MAIPSIVDACGCRGRRGAFIVFEGIDRSGKSTQSTALVKKLQDAGIRVKFMRFPNRQTEIGKVLNSYLSGNSSLPSQVAHLLFAANRWESLPEIRRCLLEGVTVVTDRFAFSGVAYSSGALGLDENWCKSADSGILSPDIVFYLNLNPEKAATRQDFGREVYENYETQIKVYHAYQSFSSESFWFSLDACLSPQELERHISEKSLSLLQSMPTVVEYSEVIKAEIIKEEEEGGGEEKKDEKRNNSLMENLTSSLLPPPLWPLCDLLIN